WLGARIEEYLRREAVVAEVERYGGRVDLEPIDWLRRDLGEDFAQVVDKLVGLHLCGPHVDDQAVEALLRHQAALQTLALLDLSGSRVSDEALGRFHVLASLRRLDLRGAPVSSDGLSRLLPLPNLE